MLAKEKATDSADVTRPTTRSSSRSAPQDRAVSTSKAAELRKGATDAVVRFVREQGGRVPADVTELSDKVRGPAEPRCRRRRAAAVGIIH